MHNNRKKWLIFIYISNEEKVRSSFLFQSKCDLFYDVKFVTVSRSSISLHYFTLGTQVSLVVSTYKLYKPGDYIYVIIFLCPLSFFYTYLYRQLRCCYYILSHCIILFIHWIIHRCYWLHIRSSFPKILSPCIFYIASIRFHRLAFRTVISYDILFILCFISITSPCSFHSCLLFSAFIYRNSRFFVKLLILQLT